MSKFQGPGEWFAQAKTGKAKKSKPEPKKRSLTPLARRRQRKETNV